MTKIYNKVEIEGSDCNIIKVIYEKYIPNIIVISEKLKTSKIKKKSQGCPFSTLLFNIILEVLARVLDQKKKPKDSIWKERSKIMSVHRGHDFTCRKSLKFHTHRKPEQKVAWYKINIQIPFQKRKYNNPIYF